MTKKILKKLKHSSKGSFLLFFVKNEKADYFV